MGALICGTVFGELAERVGQNADLIQIDVPVGRYWDGALKLDLGLASANPRKDGPLS